MKTFRVALAQIAPELGDLESNLALHLDAIGRARADGANLVVFPELSLTGYRMLDQVPDLALGSVGGNGPPVLPDELMRAASEVDVVVGFVEESPGHRYHNSAAYLSGGGVIHVHRKLYLPSYGMFDEGRDFAPGERLRSFDSPFGPCGMLICEDLWHPPSAWLLAQEGVDAIIVLSNGPTRGARRDDQVTSIGVWRDLALVTARLQTAFVIYVNRVGCEDGLTFSGGSLVVDPHGHVVAEAPALEETVVTVELEAESLRRARSAYPLLRDERLELVYRELGRIRTLRFGLTEENDDAAANGPRREPVMSNDSDRPLRAGGEGDLSIGARATVRILAEFIRTKLDRAGKRKLVVGLSGGVDSAVASCLAVEALGPESLHCLLMPYRTSSPESVEDANELVSRLGVQAETIDISPMVDAFTEVSGAVGRIRLGNVMARVRMILLFDRSADLDALVLGTSNKSELLLGYGTLHGDVASALMPLGDLYKTQVNVLAEELGVPESIRRKPPSADLWPDQTDEDELGFSYDEVDRMLALLVDERMSPQAVIRRGFSPQLVERVIRVVVASQFKRRLPAIAKLSPRSVGWDFSYPSDWTK